MASTQGKRFVTLLITLAMVTGSLLSGCSSSKEGAEKLTGSGSTNAGNKGKPEISVTIYDRGKVPPQEGTYENNRWTKWINDNGPVNVKFVPIPRNQSQDKLNTLIAAGDAPDLILEYDANFRNQLYNQKQLLPIDDLIEKYSTNYKELLNKYPILKKLGTKPDGKMYEFGTTEAELGSQFYLLIRNDWLKKLNLQMPQTIDDLYNVAKAFTEDDPNGNHKKDEYGINLSSFSGGGVNQMFGAVNWTLKDGQMIHDWDRFKAANAFKKKLYDAGIVDKDYLTDSTGQKAIQDWVTGKLGIWIAPSGTALDVNNMETLMKNQPEAEVLPMALPKTEYGQYNPQLIAPIKTTAVINADAKDPEAVMKYIDFMVSDQAGNTLHYGIEGQNYKKVNGFPDKTGFTDINKNQLDWNFDYYQLLYPRVRQKYIDDKMKDLSTPALKKVDELKKAANVIYLSPDRPVATFILPEYLPQLTKELSLIDTTVSKTIDDIWSRAVISGSSYTIDQAAADAQSTWEKAGGKQLEEYYRNWYDKNKDEAIYSKDLYNILK
ncbi:hypothetical protein BK138_29950 [Paenibacillus rhizosphaerae]|uniref:ABC transporter substrate-binding protein n=1 Tax=Paenibacillus rhizosphaerae TaxID=297318 RepID=A0A1R1EC85_9BACL|nr:extracellular solute-binding protein [Paenibacillus rhizosphaerae]OMF49425.1 hypothetical protein BK138_29950 [Paenibacillus rhizosphaerae]